MKNPFKPSEIISDPAEFFGRSREIDALGRQLKLGSIAIQGSFGVGKSSLLSRTLLHMDGFDSAEDSVYKLMVAHRDITDVEKAAQLVLEELTQIDSNTKTLSFGIPKLAQYSSTEAYRLFEDGRHLAALNKILEDKAFKIAMKSEGYLILAIDEVEKCAPAIARLFRQVITKAQLNGIANIRFVFAGVNPYVEAMVNEDPGVQRFIYETIDLKPFSPDESEEFLDSKFSELSASAADSSSPIEIDPEVITRITQLSGGHPHLLQLLGSHVVEHEHSNPDGVIDNEDLVGSLQKICYQQRATVYESLITDMRAEGKYETYVALLRLIGGVFPGEINIKKAWKQLEKQDTDWLLSRNVIAKNDDCFTIVDEMLRVRVLMDMFEDYGEIEYELIQHGALVENGDVFRQIWDRP